MPRLPVNSWAAMAGLLALAAMLASGPATAAPASDQPNAETVMYHLNRDAEIHTTERGYKSIVQTAMLYHQCPTDYGVDAVKKTAYERALYQQELLLRRAFNEGHRRLTAKYPGPDVLAAVDTQIKTRRDEYAIALAKNIHKRGCKSPTMRKLDKFFEEHRAREAEEQQKQSH